MKVVIGLAGVKTSGKSTVANMVKELFPEAQEAALADKLKNVCAEVFDIPRSTLDDQRYKEIPFEVFNMKKVLTEDSIVQILEMFNVEITDVLLDKYADIIGMELKSARHIAQIVGTEVLRATGNPDIHCDNVKMDGDIVVISDLRFSNEFSYFSKRNDVKFIPLYIQRDMAESEVTEDSHPSEKCVFEFSSKCIKIDNNNTLNDTKRQVKEVLGRELAL